MAETTQHAIVQQLREMILSSTLPPGQRLVEAHLAERMGVSRTPLRYALHTLFSEGLLEHAGQRGFAVRRFSVTDILNAIDVRGALEGLAARCVAEKGVSKALSDALQQCLDTGDALFVGGHLSTGADAGYAEMNRLFHTLLLDAAKNESLRAAMQLNDRIPFVSTATVAFSASTKEAQFTMLLYAHRQHHMIADALRRGESARVEALMKEHTQISKQSLNFSFDSENMGSPKT